MNTEDLRELVHEFKEFRKALSEISITMAKMEKELEYHMKRTDVAEARLELLESSQFDFAQEHARWKGALAISGWIVSTAIALGALLIKMF